MLSSQPMGIACEKDFPDPICTARMQAALDKLIADGTQKQIFLKYGLHLGRLAWRPAFPLDFVSVSRW